MFCRTCGKQQDDSAGFCDGCGTQLKAAAGMPTAVPAGSKKSKTGLFIALAVGVVVLIGALVAALVLFPRPMEATEYEAQVSDSLIGVMDIPEDIYAALEDASNQDSYEGIGSQTLSVFQDTVAGSSSAIASAKADLENMVPPKDYEKQHEDLLASLDKLQKVIASLSRMVSGIEPEDTPNDISDYDDQFFADMRDGARAYADMGSALRDMGLDDMLPAILEELGDPEDF